MGTRVFLAPDGRSDGVGGSSRSAVSITRAIELLQDDMTWILGAGTYIPDGLVDLTGFSGICIYGSGFVLWDGQGTLPLAFDMGDNQTITGIRFKNCRSCVRVDGRSTVLVKNCFDYQEGFTFDQEDEVAFNVMGATEAVTLSNLTSLRARRGLSIVTGGRVTNCLMTGSMGFSGQFLQGFDTEGEWIQTNPSVSHAITTDFALDRVFQGTRSPHLMASNASGFTQTANFRRSTSAANAIDFGAATRAILVLNMVDPSGLVGLDPLLVTLSSPGGSASYRITAADLDVGFTSLNIALALPTLSSGTVDFSDVRQIDLALDVADGGAVSFNVDHLEGFGAVCCLSNAVLTYAGTDPMEHFRDSGSIDPVAIPPPFLNPGRQDYRYEKSIANFETYMTAGLYGFLIGAAWQGGHIYTQEDPGHLRFNGHRVLPQWHNDESFYDSSTGLPGPDGEGLRLPLDETGVPVSPYDVETINLTATDALGLVRDVDDQTAYTFDKDNAPGTLVGTISTFSSPVDGTDDQGTGVTPIGVFGEFLIPSAVLPDVIAPGLEIVVVSTSGSITGRVPVADFVTGYNFVQVLYASPDAMSGSFDPTDILSVTLRLNVNPNVSLLGMATDHIGFVAIEGLGSTGPCAFGSDGALLIDLLVPEASVVRGISDPFKIDDVGRFFLAALSAIENDSEGAVVNASGVQQTLPTRTFEIRYSEMKFSTQGALQSIVQRDWTPISRIVGVLTDGTENDKLTLWVQTRVTLRNRVNLPTA